MSNNSISNSELLWDNQATNKSKSWVLEKGLKHHPKAKKKTITHVARIQSDPSALFPRTQSTGGKA